LISPPHFSELDDPRFPTRSKHFLLVKEGIRYAASLLAFIGVALILSWFSVYAFWYAAFAFHSVPAVRFCEAIGSVILIPVRVVFWMFGDFFDQTAPLTDPSSYAALNAVLLGTIVYSCCRRFIFEKSSASQQEEQEPANVDR
jgi:hypothetical protein